MKHRWVRAGGVFLAALVLVYWLWPNPPAAPATPLPSPNGYDDFVKAGSLLFSISEDYRQMSKEDLRSYVTTNQEPLRLVRLGLTRECQAPVDYSMDYMQRQTHALLSIKRLSQLLSAEGRLAEAEERFVDAARVHLDNVRFGHLSANGGLMIEKLLGVAVENLGLGGLERIIGKLDTRQVREIIQVLEDIDERVLSASVFIASDRQWARKTVGLFHWLEEWMMRKTIAATGQKFTAKVQAADTRRRQLLLNLAKRVHELETGRPPVRLEDMVPSILRVLPKLDGAATNANSQTPASP